MLYLLDANVLISAQELHYPLGRIPQFWSALPLQLTATKGHRLEHQGRSNWRRGFRP